jgi:acetyl/propionyl-CoA carboxylase alpha subunit
MVRALTEYDLRGIKTTIGFCRDMLSSRAFGAGEFDTTTVEHMMEKGRGAATPQDQELEELAAIAAAFAVHRLAATTVAVEPAETAMVEPPKEPAVVEATAPVAAPAKARGATPAESLWEQRARLENLRW